MDALTLEGVSKRYGEFQAVRDLSFSVRKGAICGFLGPNGAGKTSTIRMILGLQPATTGSITILGAPDGRMVRDRIGFLPEERGLYKKMTPVDAIAFFGSLKGVPTGEGRRRAKEMLEAQGLGASRNKKMKELSKGMAQKVQLIASVVHRPEFVILDEPFSGLDPVNANLIKDEIFRLAKEGHTIIFSTHRMEQVEEICNHIILVNKGTKILDGTVRGIKQDFKEDLFRIAFDDLVHPEHLAIHLFRVVESSGQELVIKKAEGFTTNDILQYFIHKNLSIHSFNEILPSLNDIFIRQVESTPTARQFQNVNA